MTEKELCGGKTFNQVMKEVEFHISNKQRIAKLEKENVELTKMIDVSFALFFPRSLEMLACSQCEYDDFGYCRIDKRDNVDYKHCKECYRKALLKHSELEKRVEK